jgi:asparagine synthase (glutamine-hydrolysing)
MSAICGIVNRDHTTIKTEKFEQMMQTLSHRGPDGSAKWIGESVALGHHMLHTTPESLNEKLPYHDPGPGLVICSDARIDNREELFNMLSIPSSQRNEITDSSLILKAYEKWDTQCTNYLLGDFAFVIWDSLNRKLFCARDHFGLKPLYYYISNSHFIFASEIKAVAIASEIVIRLNETALAEFLFMRLTSNTLTFYENVRQVAPAHTLTVYDDRIEKNQYWQLEAKSRLRLKSDNEYAEALRAYIIQSVHDRMRSAFPIATHLSGGLDSSAVACIAARKLKEEGKKLIAVSSALPLNHPGPEHDDRNYIELVAAQEQNIELNWVLAERKTPFDNLEELFEHYYEPIDDPFFYMDHSLHKTAAERGVRIMLNGSGGDMSASYNGRGALAQLTKELRWLTLFTLIRQQSAVCSTPGFKIFMRDVITVLLPKSINIFYRRFTGKSQNYLTKFDFISKNFSESSLFLDILRKMTDNLQPIANTSNNIIRSTDIVSDLANSLAYNTTTGGLYSIAMAMPLLDKRIFEFAIQLPPEQFLKNGWPRSIFRRAMEEILPPQIQWRKSKHPFSPDFHRRVLYAKSHAKNILLNTERDPIINKYLNKSAIMQQLEKTVICHGMHDWEIETQQIVIKGIMIISFLRWLNRHKQYRKRCENK